ncbi:MAG: GyrI-like domain-containing protein [Caulobacterales bacterium]|nr:GyrI-like domain-containing protein [Caulobacterales bacterium]
MTLSVAVTEAGPWRFAAVRHAGAYTGIAEAITKAASWAGAKGLIGPSTMVAGLYYDNPECVPEAELRSAGAVSVPAEAAIDGAGVEELLVPAHRAAKVVHAGPYETLAQTYGAVMEWLSTSGENWAEDAPSVEHYVDDPTTTPPETLRTVIYIPLA